MELLRANDQVHVGQPVDEFLSPALRHASHKAENLPGPFLSRLADERRHLAERLLFGHVAHAAGVEQHHVRDLLRRRKGIAPGHELRGDGFAVALVHLATVGFDVNARHGARVAQTLRQRGTLEKKEDGAPAFFQ